MKIFSGVRSTSALSTQFFFLKFSELSPVRVFRHSGFAFMLIMHPVFFNIVAGSAFPGSFKNRAIIKAPNFGNMQGGIKILVNMATLAVLAYYFIGLSRTKISLKRFLNFNIGTSGERHKKQDRQETLRCKTIGFPGKGFSKRMHKFLNCIHRGHTKPRAALAKHLIRNCPR